MADQRAPPGDDLAFLTTPAAAAALEDLALFPPAEADTLAALERLRRTFSAAQAAALLTQSRLRARARGKFPQAERLFFQEDALEQATAWPVALLRAQRLHALAPPGPVLDLGCGIGGDLLALAQFRPVIAYESDPVRAALAAHNARAAQTPFAAEVRCGDWVAEMAAGHLPQAAAAFADPARRSDGRRVFSLSAMQPPLAALLELRTRLPLLAVKVAPGVRDEALPPGCALQFISHEGACKEAVLWLGNTAAPASLPARWASVWDGEIWHEVTSAGVTPPVGEIAPGMVLYEPDPAVIRAGALVELCAALGAHLFDASIAYLVASAPPAAPVRDAGVFAAAFHLEEVHPFSLKLLNRRLSALGIGRVEIKKRGFPVEPEVLRPRLKPAPGGRAAVIFLTRRGDEHLMFIATRETTTA